MSVDTVTPIEPNSEGPTFAKGWEVGEDNPYAVYPFQFQELQFSDEGGDVDNDEADHVGEIRVHIRKAIRTGSGGKPIAEKVPKKRYRKGAIKNGAVQSTQITRGAPEVLQANDIAPDDGSEDDEPDGPPSGLVVETPNAMEVDPTSAPGTSENLNIQQSDADYMDIPEQQASVPGQTSSPTHARAYSLENAQTPHDEREDVAPVTLEEELLPVTTTQPISSSLLPRNEDDAAASTRNHGTPATGQDVVPPETGNNTEIKPKNEPNVKVKIEGQAQTNSSHSLQATDEPAVKTEEQPTAIPGRARRRQTETAINQEMPRSRYDELLGEAKQFEEMANSLREKARKRREEADQLTQDEKERRGTFSSPIVVDD
ncbi:hypothetical protein CONPUDRAFT_147711 [Coniophora puteana RWD-64-598 SS2]|uniref:Uncharacterized protein n=1 Tax=Coniophora puteana (strain RWD-64-598) TaxID=741705 RepID=R7SDT9_CONPW|nr:uncharacterized protein CONPUDRAFT_147711 [Coniophora puteana RWD-64-598 SS2]EIW74333.1 hypothetical protein CONPUDRAFT_147711 [Coniophora puteana RWD-64-598 SS2]